jgi:hypothetical protein
VGELAPLVRGLLGLQPGRAKGTIDEEVSILVDPRF